MIIVYFIEKDGGDVVLKVDLILKHLLGRLGCVDRGRKLGGTLLSCARQNGLWPAAQHMERTGP